MVKDYPHMIHEVMDAIEEYYKKDEDVMVDCMLYLKDATEMAGDSRIVERWFEEHNRCPTCGEPLAIHHYKEPHTECGVGVYEDMAIPYCPNCDIEEGIY